MNQPEKPRTAPRNTEPHWLSGLKTSAMDMGFVRIGIAPAVDATGFSNLVRWIEDGYAADMDYFANRLDAYRHPGAVLAGVKSILVMAYPYPADAPEPLPDHHGRVARYAWPGTDYHDVIHIKLKQLKALLGEIAPDVTCRGCVDTAPLLEREIAQRAGLGWRGKNTLLLNRDLGSYFFLACLLVDAELPYDTPDEHSYCGTCTACLQACPTDAFPQPGVLDASRCISYLTIENRGETPAPLRSDLNDWAFGCDVCQEVCPWNRKPTRQSETPANLSPLRQLNLIEILELDEAGFRDRFRKTPLWRTRLRGMQRNAAIVLANRRDRSALDALARLAESDDNVVAETCRWAIETILAEQPPKQTDAT